MMVLGLGLIQMAYNYRRGIQFIGDISGSDDPDKNTGIDFGDDTISLVADGQETLVVNHSKVGIGTNAPDAQLHISNNSTDDLFSLETTEDSNSASPIIKLKRNSSSPADADYLGQFKFQGENDADQNVTYAKISGKIGSVADGTEQGIIEVANMKNGSSTITARFRHDSLQLLNSTNLSVGGTAEISQYLYHKGDTDTFINFTDDRIRFNAGNLNFIDCEKAGSAPHKVKINNGGNNIDFLIKDSSGNIYLRADADTARLGIGTETPSSTLTVTGSNSRSIATITGVSNAIGSSHYTVLLDADSGNCAAQLPAASGIAGRIYIFKRIDGSHNHVKVQSNGSEEIEGSTNDLDINNQYESFTLQCDGTGWWIISDNHV